MSDTECILIITSNIIGSVISLLFVSLVIWKVWFIHNDFEKITMYIQKNIIYFSYLFFLFAFSSFILNLIYIGMNCNDNTDGFKYDFIVIILILCLSIFKLTFNLLIIFQLFYGFKGLNNISLTIKCRNIFILFIFIQFFIEIFYDIYISFFSFQFNVIIFPSIFLGIDLLIAISIIIAFIQKLSSSIRYFKTDFDGNNNDENHNDTKNITQTSVICIIAVILRIIYLTLVIIDEIVYQPSNDKNDFNIIYVIREWITMICISIQLLSIYLLFPFSQKYYYKLCKVCDQCCYIHVIEKKQQQQSMDDYQQL